MFQGKSSIVRMGFAYEKVIIFIIDSTIDTKEFR